MTLALLLDALRNDDDSRPRAKRHVEWAPHVPAPGASAVLPADAELVRRVNARDATTFTR